MHAASATNITGVAAIANGGTGQDTAQEAIDALTQVAGATNEHVLTKDTATGNAIFKAAGGGVPTQLDSDGTTLDINVITDGEFLKRVGTTIVSAAGGGGLSEAEILGRMCAMGSL